MHKWVILFIQMRVANENFAIINKFIIKTLWIKFGLIIIILKYNNNNSFFLHKRFVEFIVKYLIILIYTFI